MAIGWESFWLSHEELNNNKLSPEIDKVLEDSLLTNQERDFLYNHFNEKRNEIYDISKDKLNELRQVIWSKSKLWWITDRDMNKLKNYSWSNETAKQNITKDISESEWIVAKEEKKEETTLNEKIKIYEKEFPTIKNVKELIDSIQNMQKYQTYIKQRLAWIDKRWLNDSTIITIKYNWKKDNVRISDLKWILKAVDFIIDADKLWITDSNNSEIDTKAISSYTRKYLEKNDIKWVERIVAEAISYVWKTESNKRLKYDINNTIKSLDKQWFNIKLEAWCAAFVRHVLVESGFKELAKNMDNTALSALWFPYKTWGHIWIYVWWNRFIDWNSGRNTDRVTKDSIYRTYRKDWFIGRIKPSDIWDKSKVNFDLPPLVWSIMVFARWKDYKAKAAKYRSKLKKV